MDFMEIPWISLKFNGFHEILWISLNFMGISLCPSMARLALESQA
jgi:hypothetical protein